MKKKKLAGKLVIRKTTIACLSKVEMNSNRAGVSPSEVGTCNTGACCYNNDTNP